jgi:hypothetical protein
VFGFQKTKKRGNHRKLTGIFNLVHFPYLAQVIFYDLEWYNIVITKSWQKSNKYFELMNLNSNYHQFPLDTSISVLTAFITFIGVFECLRVPIRGKPAVNYFNDTITNIVLID